MKFKFIRPGGAEYSKERMLRWEVLHKPLGMPPGSEGIPEEDASLHLVALQDKALVGCVCFHPESQTLGQIYQMAVSQEYRGRGFGRRLIATMEQALMQKGFKDVYLYTGQESEGFYSQMGYHPDGEWVRRMGVPQKRMRKAL